MKKIWTTKSTLILKNVEKKRKDELRLKQREKHQQNQKGK